MLEALYQQHLDYIAPASETRSNSARGRAHVDFYASEAGQVVGTAALISFAAKIGFRIAEISHLERLVLEFVLGLGLSRLGLPGYASGMARQDDPHFKLTADDDVVPELPATRRICWEGSTAHEDWIHNAPIMGREHHSPSSEERVLSHTANFPRECGGGGAH